MGFPKEIYQMASSVLSERRQKAKEVSAHNRQEIYRLVPQIQVYDNKLASIGMRTIQAVASSPDKIEGIIEELKNQSLELQQKRDDLLDEVGLLEFYREDNYTCKKCQDTGYIGNKKCDCFKKLLMQAAFESLGAGRPQDCRFSNFFLEYYSEQPLKNGLIPREKMTYIKNFCEDYVRNFTVKSHARKEGELLLTSKISPSLLFLGDTGLGKTHLSLAIAGEVIGKGYGVIYGSAQNVMAKLEREKFNYSYQQDHEQQSYLSMILECDLLILDDLGTELLNQFVTATLYNIINTRLLDGRPTIISTNLTFLEISHRYTNRLVSRLFGGYIQHEFQGKDIRIQSKLEG